MNSTTDPEQTTPPNPYTPNEPVQQGGLFVGRTELFDWVQQTSGHASTENPCVLLGTSQIGKTSFLQQIQYGKLEPAYIGIYLNLSDTPHDSLSAFMWDIAQSATEQLHRFDLSLPPLTRTDFIAAPFKAFREKFLLPATVALNEAIHDDGEEMNSGQTKLLFLFDNLHDLLKAENQGLSNELFIELHKQIVKNHLAVCLYTYTSSIEDEPFPYGEMCILEQMKPLTKAEAIGLIRAPSQYTVFNDVADYIANITEQQPHAIQLICHAIYERYAQYQIRYVTVADVNIIENELVERRFIPSPSKENASFYIEPNENMMQTVQRSRQKRIQQSRNRLPTAVILVILFVCIFFAGTAVVFSATNGSEVAALFGNDPSSAETSTPLPPSPTIDTVAIVDEALTATAAVITPSATPSSIPTETPTSTPTATNTPTNTPTPTPSVYPTMITRSQDGMPMILIPAGTFTMGSSEDDFRSAPDERPLHDVTLDQFYIDQYEVSTEQYAAFLNRIGTYDKACQHVDCTQPRSLAGYTTYLIDQDLGDGTIQYFALAGYADYPINHVSWFGASEYCESVGARLPTEAEWEYAARGTEGRIYPWGDTPPSPEKAVYQSESFENVKAVDALPDGATPDGVYGMAGSLWEWTADWYEEDYYANSPLENPPGPETGLNRVARGGAWPNNNEADRIRSANRSAFAPEIISAIIGFRCVRTP